MNAFKKVDFNTLCRFCITAKSQTLDLFSDGHDDLANKILNCLSIKVEEKDNLPRKICTFCFGELNKFEKFRLKCIKSVANLECYYSLFKDTIDNDGTIFLKAEDALAKPEDIFSKNTKEASSSKTTTENASLVSIQPIASDANVNKSIPNYPPIEVFNKPNESINNISSLEADTDQAPFTSSTDDIIVVDINKCNNILNLISPGASIYVVNNNPNEEKVPCDEVAFNDESASKELDKVLNTANLDISNFDPVLDQQGIENISQFLSELCSEEKSIEKQNESDICQFLPHQLGSQEKCQGLDSDSFKTNVHSSEVDSLKILMSNVEELETNKKSSFMCDDFNRNDLTDIIKNKEGNTSSEKTVKECINFLETKLSKNEEEDVSKTNEIKVTELPLPSMKQIEMLQSKISNVAENTRKINCPECGKAFDKIKGYNIHRSSHFLSNAEDHLCLICNKQFNTRALLKSHMTIHQPDRKPVTCTLCNKTFCRIQSLNRHMNSYHSTEEGSFDSNCRICSKESKNKEYLRNHILCRKKSQRLVKPERQYECKDCNILFEKKNDFELHQRIVHFKGTSAIILDDEDDSCYSLLSNNTNMDNLCPVNKNNDSRLTLQAKASDMLDSAFSMLDNVSVLPDRCSTPIGPLSPSILDTPRKMISPLNTLSDLNTSKLMSMFSTPEKLPAMNFDGFPSESLFQRIHDNVESDFDCNNKDMSDTSFFDLDDLLTETTKSIETDNSAYLLTKNSPETNDPDDISSDRAFCIDFPLKPVTQQNQSKLSASENVGNQGQQTLYVQSGTGNGSTSSISNFNLDEKSLTLNHQSSEIDRIGEMSCTVYLDDDTEETKETIPSHPVNNSDVNMSYQRKRKKPLMTHKSGKVKVNRVNNLNEPDHNYFKDVKSSKPSVYDELVSGKDTTSRFEDKQITLTVNKKTATRKKNNTNSQQQKLHMKPSDIKSNPNIEATDSTHSFNIKNLLSEQCEDTEQPTVRTINILLENFNKKSDEIDNEKTSKQLLLGQPYNIRKAKDIQTYICAMEDT